MTFSNNVSKMEGCLVNICWFFLTGHAIAFLLAFAIGTNDAASSFGTSIGSGVLTQRQASLLAGFFEISGAVLLGFKVSEIMQKPIIDLSLYDDDPSRLLIGCVSALAGCTMWLLIATYFGMPVSSMHSMFGSIVAFSLVAKGLRGIDSNQLVYILLSWVVAPIVSGLMSLLIFYAVRLFVFYKKGAFKAGLMLVPIAYSATIFISVAAVLHQGSSTFGLADIQAGSLFLCSLAGALVAGLVAQFFLVPFIRKKVMTGLDPESDERFNYWRRFLNFVRRRTHRETNAIDLDDPQLITRSLEIKRVNYLFKFLQTLTAVFVSFVHGGNDVSNAISPLVGIYTVFANGSSSGVLAAEVPIYMLLLSGIAIAIGLNCWGGRVIETVGQRITSMTPTIGCIIEFSAACTVLLACIAGYPLSTTHCQLGAVMVVGWANSRSHYVTEDSLDSLHYHEDKELINWKLIRKIAAAWAVSLPISGCFTAIFMAILMKIYEKELSF